MTFTQFIYAVTDKQNLLAAAVGVAAFAAMLSALPLLSPDPLQQRMKGIATARDDLRRKARQAMSKETPTLRMESKSAFKGIVDKLDLKRALADPKLPDRLAQAGFRGQSPVSVYYFARLASTIAMGALAAFYLFVVNGFGLNANQKMVGVAASVLLGYHAPNLYLQNRAKKRRDSIVGAFPDALDLLLICVEAGMSIEAALHRVAGEIGGASIELAEELSLLVAELAYLQDRRLAYEGLQKRINHPGVNATAVAMIQAEKYGTPLGVALRVMAKENRELRLAAAEKKAAALSPKLTVPMILFFLPVLFLVIISPIAIRLNHMD